MQITQAILPVAGLGTRFLPWTKVVPKELLPIGNKPVIAHIVDECIDIGITDICFVINKGKESIPQFFYENPELENELKKRGKIEMLSQLQKYDDVDFHVVYQDEQLGDGHAILQAADWVESDHVAVLFGDDLFVGDKAGLAQLKEAAEKIADDASIVALENIPKDQTDKYGIVEFESEEGNLKKLKSMVEKPDPAVAPSTLGIVGRYIIPKSMFAILKELGGLPTIAGGDERNRNSAHLRQGYGGQPPAEAGGEIRIIDALIEQMKTSPVYGYECDGPRIDTGTPEGYAKAVKLLGHEY